MSKLLRRYDRGPDYGSGVYSRRNGDRVVMAVWPQGRYACYELDGEQLIHRGVCEGVRAAVAWLDRRQVDVVPIPGISKA